MSSQLGAQFSEPRYRAGGTVFDFVQTVLTPHTRVSVTPPGVLRLGQTLYVLITAQNTGTFARQLWLMPWWLHPTFEYRFPGQGVYTTDDLARFGVQNPVIAQQDSLWMTSPKRLDITGAPSPFGTSISDMQSDVWALDVPAGETVKKSFFYPSHGYGLAQTAQIRDVGDPMDGSVRFTISVTPGATHAVFQDGQG
jgi:hypothetical protein